MSKVRIKDKSCLFAVRNIKSFDIAFNELFHKSFELAKGEVRKVLKATADTSTSQFPYLESKVW